MYDITSIKNISINKMGQLINNEIIEDNILTSFENGGSILTNNFYEY